MAEVDERRRAMTPMRTMGLAPVRPADATVTETLREIGKPTLVDVLTPVLQQNEAVVMA
jgi:hypothetical protein